ncbi:MULTISPECIES: sporulation integral membrane protein YtvI [unclassified Paenibacillus]|uniref:sporulation integral membrane protein YtvI n=1 Tax=unclassified Paenibacillus TaxID=185978 RepID=UPI001C11720A|nr:MULTISPECIES: sporulation integral membrane protein YtvI [unclassified Paenibacillus]MBU5441586.1 sporulation integral membrane protein YtvI [Paenibacillus sp. MSJ-34]
MEKIVLQRVLRGLWVVCIASVAVFLMYKAAPLVYPFVIAWLIAYILNPFVDLLQNKLKFPRWMAVVSTLILFVGAALTVIAAAITRIIVEVLHLLQNMEGSIENWKHMIVNFIKNVEVQRFVRQIAFLYEQNPNYQATINNNLNNTAQTVANALSSLIRFLLNSFLNFLYSLPNIATIMIVILLSVFFISKDWKRLTQFILSWFPNRVRDPASLIWNDLRKALFGYMRTQCLLISMTAVIVTIGLLVLRVEYAITIGMLIGLVDLLPYLGLGAAMIPWIAYSFMNGNESLGIGLSVIYLLVLIIRQIVEPKVLAANVGLDPLAILIGMFVGLKLFGLLGMLAGPAALVVLSAVKRANVFRDIRNYIMGGDKK